MTADSKVVQANVPSLWIRDITRYPELGAEDHLSLEPGVNVIVGVPNTGKSKWLRMIDYLFGDDKEPIEAFGEDLATKYEKARATIAVGDEEWSLERSWHEAAATTKITVDGEQTTRHAFTLRLMASLGIPVLHYPQGNPYGVRGWPELGWRSLVRHMYRRQSFWADLADKQPESEQHACILQFVGLAEVLFSEKYAELVSLEKQVQKYQSQREQFVAMLQDVSRELIDEKGLGVALTPDSIASAIARHEADIATLQQQREAALRRVLDDAMTVDSAGEAPPAPRDLIEALGREMASLRVTQAATLAAIRQTEDRTSELRSHRGLVADELSRMERAAEAGSLLGDLRITHCPSCDRPIRESDRPLDSCALCNRPLDVAATSETAADRLRFEVEQLRAELRETDESIDVLAEEAARLNKEHGSIQEQVTRTDSQLRPVRTAAAAVLPPELTVLAQETGRLHERVAQLKRVRATLDKRETLAAEIERLQGQVAALDKVLADQFRGVSFERVGDLLTDGMNTYLNEINEKKPGAWPLPEVEFVLRDRTFAVRIGRSSWNSKLGGTLTLFFLLAYHYSLMTLTGKPGCHYPGLCILDFPAELGGVAVSDSETFVLEPFVRLLSHSGAPPRQVIAAGSSFGGLKGAHRIELSRVWV